MEQLGGYTALLFAARAGNLDSARVLLDAGADVNDEAPNGTSALVVAAHSGQGQLAAFLLDKGADANAAAAGYTALHAAVLRGDLALVKALLAHGADPNATLTNGTRSRYFSSDYAFNASFVGATSYWLAARYAEVEMMTILAAAGADPRRPAADFSSPLLAVLAGGSSFGSSDRRERYLTPTELAAQSPEKEQQLTLQAATLAVTLGADVNARTKKGDTALHLAASRWDARLVQFLIEHGGDVNASNDDGETPLHNAAYLAKRDVITLLVDHGANLAASNKKGETPLRKTAIRVRAVAVGVFVTDDELDTTAALLRQLGATE
jgi:cytohesin